MHLNLPPERGAFPEELLRKGVGAVLAAEGADAGEISLTLLGDEEIRELHLRWLGIDHPTDVLAFHLHAEGEPPVGDVYVGWEQALRQAGEEGVPADEELLRLAIHGTLHVLGWEHPEAAGARADSPMYRRQEEILARVLAGSGEGGEAGGQGEGAESEG